MRSRIAQSFLLLLGIAGVTGLAPAPPSEAEFTRQMAERFRAALPGRDVEITEPLQFRIRAEPEPLTINVGRVFNFCAHATADECRDSIDRFVASTADALSNAAAQITRAQLRLLVRNTEYCDYAAAAGTSGNLRRPVTRNVAPGLCVILMADFPTTMRSVPAEDLRRLGLDADAAWALAERQTLADLPHPEAIEGLRGGIAVVTGFDYVTSLLLNREGWRAATAAQGELIVAVPASDTLVVARRAALGDLAGFRAAVRQHFETAERGVSPNLYHWTAAGWALLE